MTPSETKSFCFGRGVFPAHLAGLLDQQAAALGQCVFCSTPPSIGMHEVGREVVDAVVLVLQRCGELRRGLLGASRPPAAPTTAIATRPEPSRVQRTQHHRCNLTTVAGSPRGYRACVAKMSAVVDGASGLTIGVEATKLTPRSTMSVCCRSAMTWPKPMRRIVSDASHDSMRIDHVHAAEIDGPAKRLSPTPLSAAERLPTTAGNGHVVTGRNGLSVAARQPVERVATDPRRRAASRATGFSTHST